MIAYKAKALTHCHDEFFDLGDDGISHIVFVVVVRFFYVYIVQQVFVTKRADSKRGSLYIGNCQGKIIRQAAIGCIIISSQVIF